MWRSTALPLPRPVAARGLPIHFPARVREIFSLEPGYSLQNFALPSILIFFLSRRAEFQGSGGIGFLSIAYLCSAFLRASVCQFRVSLLEQLSLLLPIVWFAVSDCFPSSNGVMQWRTGALERLVALSLVLQNMRESPSMRRVSIRLAKNCYLQRLPNPSQKRSSRMEIMSRKAVRRTKMEEVSEHCPLLSCGRF